VSQKIKPERLWITLHYQLSACGREMLIVGKDLVLPESTYQIAHSIESEKMKISERKSALS
jgi:hypothetical protein